MKKGEQYTGTVEKLEFPNKGVIPVEDGKVIVKNVIPSQKVSFVIQKKQLYLFVLKGVFQIYRSCKISYKLIIKQKRLTCIGKDIVKPCLTFLAL